MAHEPKRPADQPEPRVHLRLFVAAHSPNSIQALTHLRAATSELGDHCDVEIIDVLATPARALLERILVTPTLVRVAPAPQVRIVGNLSDAAPLRRMLGLS